MSWPTQSADGFVAPEGREDHRLDVYLDKGQVVDVRLDGESVWPTWFKVEWKGTGDVSAKVNGIRLATRFGDTIAMHEGAPTEPAPTAADTRATRPRPARPARQPAAPSNLPPWSRGSRAGA